MFETLENEFKNTIKWEAQMLFVVAFAGLEIGQFHPLAALQLSIEGGHDTDSYAQMVGAFIGALHGTGIFPAGLRAPVENRLPADFQFDLAGEVKCLVGLNAKTEISGLVQPR